MVVEKACVQPPEQSHPQPCPLQLMPEGLLPKTDAVRLHKMIDTAKKREEGAIDISSGKW